MKTIKRIWLGMWVIIISFTIIPFLSTYRGLEGIIAGDFDENSFNPFKTL